MQTSRSGISATCATFGIGYMGYMFMPTQLSSLAGRLSLNETEIGFIGSVQLAAVALSLFFFSFRKGPKPQAYLLALSGGLLAFGAYLLTALTHSLFVAQIAMALAGLGMGTALFAGNAGISAATSPEKVFAMGLVAHQSAAAFLIVMVVPAMPDGLHAHLVLSVWTLFICLILFLSGPITVQHERPAVSITGFSYYFLSAVPLLFLGFIDAAVWPFTGEIGARIGLEQQEIVNVQGGALMAGIVGTLLAGILAKNAMRHILFVGSSIAAVAFYYYVLNAMTPIVYAGSQIGALFAYGFFIPFYFAICAHQDKSGRLMAIASALQMIGLAVGPWLAGVIYSTYDEHFLGLVVAIFLVLALLLSLIAQFRAKLNHHKAEI